jgi:hypothetical protein
MKRMFRYEVPVDDRTHAIQTTSAPQHIGCREVGVVEFWAEHDDTAEPFSSRYTVVGTGHQVPEGAAYLGTAPHESGLVWHLYRMPHETVGEKA